MVEAKQVGRLMKELAADETLERAALKSGMSEVTDSGNASVTHKPSISSARASTCQASGFRPNCGSITNISRNTTGERKRPIFFVKSIGFRRVFPQRKKLSASTSRKVFFDKNQPWI